MGFFLEEELGNVRRIQQEGEPLLLALSVGRAHGKECRQPLKTERTWADSQQGPHSLHRAQTPVVPACQPHRNRELIRGCCLQLVVARVWVNRGMNRQNPEDFYGSESTEYVTIITDTCHHTFVQIYRMCNTKSGL